MKLLNLASLAFVIVAVLMFPAAAGFAQDYPLVEGGLQVDDGDSTSDHQLVPGETLTLRGGGFEPGAEVVVTIESTPLQLAVTHADERGAIAVAVTIPPGFPVGDHTLKATGQAVLGGLIVLAQAVEVVPAAGADAPASGAPATDADGAELARTGTHASRWLAIAGLAIVGGVVAVIAVRRPAAN